MTNDDSKTKINTGGGDVAGHDIDKRQGEVFVENSTIEGDVIAGIRSWATRSPLSTQYPTRDCLRLTPPTEVCAGENKEVVDRPDDEVVLADNRYSMQGSFVHGTPL